MSLGVRGDGSHWPFDRPIHNSCTGVEFCLVFIAFKLTVKCDLILSNSNASRCPKVYRIDRSDVNDSVLPTFEFECQFF